MNTDSTQADAILAYLEQGYSITPLDALGRFGCFRLGARIWELKQRGWEIDSMMVKTINGKRVAKYWLKGERERASRALVG